MNAQKTPQQILAVFEQALRLALALIEADKTPATRAPRRDASSIAPGIYPAQSKYNPFRAYVWNGEKQVYLGMFPTVSKAKAAQRAYRKGRQPADGTRKANSRAPLQIVHGGR